MEAGKRGRRVLLLDHAAKPGEKIRISGGGRCNFTNLHTGPDNFLSQNKRFCQSALARYTPSDFVALVDKHGIAYHEKGRGQLFCDGLSHQIIDMLLSECRDSGVQLQLGMTIAEVIKMGCGFQVQTSAGNIDCESLVIATGGLSIPKMGATNLGYRLARQFGLAMIPTRPALVPFTWSETQAAQWCGLAGVSIEATVGCGKQSFREGLLFTHRGIRGPSVLQISSYWEDGATVGVDLAPALELGSHLLAAKRATPYIEAASALSSVLPRRLAHTLAETYARGRLGEQTDRQLQQLASAIHRWRFIPNGTEGYRTAEVTRGGVSTDELSSQTMQCRRVPKLFFIGEVVDVTGQLGGYNFQWAWSSGFAAGQAV